MLYFVFKLITRDYPCGIKKLRIHGWVKGHQLWVVNGQSRWHAERLELWVVQGAIKCLTRRKNRHLLVSMNIIDVASGKSLLPIMLDGPAHSYKLANKLPIPADRNPDTASEARHQPSSSMDRRINIYYNFLELVAPFLLLMLRWRRVLGLSHITCGFQHHQP